mmetsp:Transcript_7992/g.16618  ORF Transcript_7992/g.16618 Transcript_7992/m.16618 type:complete len:853 (-) Transcript_7992:241-2799(-)
MTVTDVPAGDSEPGKPTETMEEQAPPPEAKAVDSDAKSGSDAKGIKARTCERVGIGFLVAIVVILAVFGLVFTLVREKQGKNKMYNWGDDYYHDDSYYNDDYYYDDAFAGEPITENPFKVDVEYFSTRSAEPYASVEDLREDIEVLAKQLANNAILREANPYRHEHHYYDDRTSIMMEDATITSTPSDFTSKESSSSNSVPDGFFRGVDDFETYQHELGAVKHDMVKSNGAYVFAAVDSRIEVWDLEGNLFETTKMQSLGTDLYIDALLMNPEGTKLVVITSDYNGNHGAWDYIISDALNTKIVVFSIEGSSLTRISETNIDGHHQSSYSVGNNVHIVTKSSLNTWNHFDDHLYRHNFGSQNAEEYVGEATQKAKDYIIPTFVDQFVDLVTDGDEILLSPIVGFPGNSKSLTQVNSFDLSQIEGKADLLSNLSKSLVLQPGHTGFVYATADFIWVADEDWNWGFDTDSQTETTLIGLRLDGASTNFAATTTIPGQLLSQFSIDFVKDNEKEYVRVAVTQNMMNVGWWEPRPFLPEPMPEPMFEANFDFEVVEEPDVATISALPGKRRLEQEPLPINPRPFFPPSEDESRTLNEIIIFEVPAAGAGSSELVELGSVEVGKKNELITAVRFFDKISYVVTFERTDPFYVLDLSDPYNPMVLGELEVPGFSEFMHPITADNSVLLTVGQDANEFGAVTGFQISIFDSSNPSDPQLIDRMVIDNGSSSASWDERAFRYIQVGEVGRLIIPLYENSYDRFGNSVKPVDGFSVFGVNLNATDTLITRELDINHWEEQKHSYDATGCYCGGVYLPARSFVFDGNLMSMKTSKVVSTDLASGETRWSFSLKNNGECCSNP